MGLKRTLLSTVGACSERLEATGCKRLKVVSSVLGLTPKMTHFFWLTIVNMKARRLSTRAQVTGVSEHPNPGAQDELGKHTLFENTARFTLVGLSKRIKKTSQVTSQTSRMSWRIHELRTGAPLRRRHGRYRRP